MRIGNRLVIAALTVLGLVGVSGQASAQGHPLFHLYHALWELRDARLELRESRYQFGEHKIRAEIAIDESIRQIELILRNVGDYARGEPRRSEFREEYRRYPHHPHLHHAVVEMRFAQRELREARYGFGGHKEAALRDMEAAIVQIELMLKYARR